MSLKLLGCNIYISYPLIACLTAAVVLDNGKTLFYSMLAAACHEAGHLIAMKYCKCAPKYIRLTLFSAAIRDSMSGLRSRAKQLIISASGCAVNFLLFFCLLFLKFFFDSQAMDLFISANFFIGLFNILPVSQLDGGDILTIILSFFVTPIVCERLTKIISFVVLIVLFTFSINVLINNKYNYSYFITSCYLFCIVFFKQ